MLRFQAGDEAGFDELVEAYQGQVFSLLRRLLGPHGEVEDLAQEVFLRVHRARAEYRPDSRFGTYLYRVTYNLALNRLRDERRRPVVRAPEHWGGDPLEFPAPAGPDPARRADTATWTRWIELALAELPENQRAALVLQHYNGLDLEEIGAVLGVSDKAVKSLLHRARENLRPLLEPYRDREFRT